MNEKSSTGKTNAAPGKCKTPGSTFGVWGDFKQMVDNQASGLLWQ